MESASIHKKLIFNHKYIIIKDSETYYGRCICPESYLFTGVIKTDLIDKFIGLEYFSEKDYFIDQHAKMD
jgi:hypothetical protein